MILGVGLAQLAVRVFYRSVHVSNDPSDRALLLVADQGAAFVFVAVDHCTTKHPPSI